ncbi:MAG: nucleoside hydrolase [Actinomycetota bacterium]
MRRTVAVLGALVLVLGACSGSGDEDARTPVVVDTDMGQDDMMALLYLLQRPDVRVEAITVSGTGLAHCGPGVDIALSLLDVAGAPAGVPVACGPEDPLPSAYPYPGAFPSSWRLATDDAYGISLPESNRTPSGSSAPELLASAIREAGTPVELLTLGPLTNVALALRADPGLAEDLAGITIMGGALDVSGNVIRNAVAEFNVWVDPVALREVLDAGAPVTLVPLDATNDAPVTPFFADALAGHHVSPEAAAVQELFEAQPFLLSGQYFFWDPLSAAILVEPELGAFEERTVAVLDGEKETQGQLVDDPEGAVTRVAVSPDALAFEREFLNTLNGDEAVATTRPEPIATIGIDDGGCTYRGPTTLPTELVAVEVDSTASGPWGAMVLSIAEGHSFADVEEVVATFRPTDEPPTWVSFAAQTYGIPGETALLPLRLEAGSYGLVCQRDDPWTLQPVTEILAG